MDQRLRNFEGRSQQFWSSVLSGHLDLPTVGGDMLTLPKLDLERSLTRGTGRQAGEDIYIDEKTELEVYSFSNQEPM